jgi:hypothetical protein
MKNIDDTLYGYNKRLDLQAQIIFYQHNCICAD